MRLSDYRNNEPKPGLTRQVLLGSLFLHLTGCALTGINNPLIERDLLGAARVEPGETTGKVTAEAGAVRLGTALH
jgi:hypothetical protein